MLATQDRFDGVFLAALGLPWVALLSVLGLNTATTRLKAGSPLL